MGVETFLPPTSSHVDQCDWDNESEDLTVTFSGGDQYLYRNISKGEWRRLQQSQSTGGFIHRVIQRLSPGERL